MLRFLLGSLLLATLLFRVVFLLPIDFAGAMQWPWYCDKPCTSNTVKNYGAFLPNLLAQHVDTVSACRSFCLLRDQMWDQLQIPSEELKNMYTNSAKYMVSLLRRNDPILTCMLQALVLYSFPVQVLYFLAVFLCTACARLLNKLVTLNILLLIGCSAFHVYRMWVATRGRVDPLAAFAEVGLEGVITPIILLLLVVTTPKKARAAAKGASRKQKQK